MTRALAPAALVALCSLAAGCAFSASGRSPTDGGGDAHVETGRDAATRSPDASAPASDGGALAPGEYDRGDPAAGGLDSCFNGVDDDDDGYGDCADRSCRANVPACCTGASDPVCCVPGERVELPIADCAGDVTGCASLVALAEPFGAPRSEVISTGELTSALVPRGAASDSGLRLRDVIDPRASAVRLEARIAGTRRHDEGSDVVAVGLAPAEAALPAVVAPLVAFQVSGNRGEVSLLVAGEIVGRWELEDEGFADYALTVRPSGSVELTRDGAPLGASTLLIERPVQAIVYGRTFNPTATSPDPVRVESLSVRPDACDVPSALGGGGLVLPPEGDVTWSGARRVAAPSVARWTDAGGAPERRMAFEIDGAIHLAGHDGAAWVTNPAAPALVGGAPWAARLGDPALVWNGAALELWFTGYAGETGTIARVVAPEGTETFAWEDVEVLLAPGAGESFAQPAPFAGGVVVRARGASGDGLVLYRASGSSLVRGEVLREPSGALAAFDRDEVASPSIVHTGSAYRLYFAGRRGLRWSVGVLISPDGATWMEPHGGALVRAPSGEGFDALGVTDPAPVIDGDVLHLYYTALDGERARIGVATGAAPPR